jgi:hypothetical protein
MAFYFTTEARRHGEKKHLAADERRSTLTRTLISISILLNQRSSGLICGNTGFSPRLRASVVKFHFPFHSSIIFTKSPNR